jgi:uncharacterized membrane protein YhaH (DUF805 family)
MTVRDKMFSFEGRLRRRDYWAISLCLGIGSFLLIELVMWAVFGSEYSMFTGGMVQASRLRVADRWPYLVQLLLSLCVAWPAFAMSAKRAHDRGKGAALVLTATGLLWINSFGQTFFMNGPAVDDPRLSSILGILALNLVVFAASVYVFVTVGCLDGTPGPNRFGPSPKAAELPEPA